MDIVASCSRDDLCPDGEAVRGSSQVPDAGRGHRDHAGRDGGRGTSSRRTRRTGSDATGALPREWHRRQAHRCGWQDIRHSIRGGAAGKLDRRLSATRRRWPEWNRGRADRQSGRRGQAGAGTRFRRRHQRHRTSKHRRRLRRDASCRTNRPHSISSSSRSGG